MSRPFRPRPLDIHKKLPIVKSVKDLDIDEATVVSRSNAVGYSDIEPVQPPPTKRKAGEIPTPQYVVVESYERDYKRTFIQPPSYVRSRGPKSEATESVEYDLDNEDDDWLGSFNEKELLLSPESFEWMLCKLELFDYKARERAGAVPAVYGVPVPVYLQQEAAFEVLQSQSSKAEVIAAVFDYWREKRERWQKPVLRRLQPPPPVNDTNPFNVFRPREKIHRPHTRRTQRRENDLTSFDKLRQVHCNLEQAKVLLEMLQKREEKKRELLECEVHSQKMRINLKHDAGVEDELVMGEMAMPSAPFSLVLDQGENTRCTWKRRRAHFQARGRLSKRVTMVDTLEPVFLFVKPIDPEKLAAAGIVPPLAANVRSDASVQPYQFQGRIGRGGRLIFDRWNPLTRTPIGYDNVLSAPSMRSCPSPTRLNLDKETAASGVATVENGELPRST